MTPTRFFPACLAVLIFLVAAVQPLFGAADPAEITTNRIAALPANQQAAWWQYWERSRAQSKLDHEAIAAEVASAGLKESTSAPNARDFRWDASKPLGWFSGDEAKDLGEMVISYQTPGGGWSKHVGYDHMRRKGERYAAGEGWSYVATFDNGATVTQLRFLARMYQGTGEEIYRTSILRGLDYIFMSQYPGGGWPQVYPLMGGYHDAITYNDDAMINILRLLRDVADKKPGFVFVPDNVRTHAAASLKRGIDCILATQVTVNGRRTVWGQQHDALTLKPTSARAYEMISLTGGESSGIVTFLMELESPATEIVRAVHDAAAWLKQTAITGCEWRMQDGVRQLVPAPGAGPIWARYYEIGTNKPLFGDRDHSIHYDVKEISAERRNGYAWYTGGAQIALKKYEEWGRKHLANTEK